MPLYVCGNQDCNVIENSASPNSNYINYVMRKIEYPSCSECLTGEWHNLFPKQVATVKIIQEKGLENFEYLGNLEKELKK